MISYFAQTCPNSLLEVMVKDFLLAVIVTFIRLHPVPCSSGFITCIMTYFWINTVAEWGQRENWGSEEPRRGLPGVQGNKLEMKIKVLLWYCHGKWNKMSSQWKISVDIKERCDLSMSWVSLICDWKTTKQNDPIFKKVCFLFLCILQPLDRFWGSIAVCWWQMIFNFHFISCQWRFPR